MPLSLAIISTAGTALAAVSTLISTLAALGILPRRKGSMRQPSVCTDDMVLLGDTKDPDGPVLPYTHAEWKAFLAGIRNGDFDDLG